MRQYFPTTLKLAAVRHSRMGSNYYGPGVVFQNVLNIWTKKTMKFKKKGINKQTKTSHSSEHDARCMMLKAHHVQNKVEVIRDNPASRLKSSSLAVKPSWAITHLLKGDLLLPIYILAPTSSPSCHLHSWALINNFGLPSFRGLLITVGSVLI